MLLTAVRLPLELARGIVDGLQGLAEFPAALERTLRETNALVSDVRTQLAGLQNQVARIAAQLETMAPAVDRLIERTAPLGDVVADACRELTIVSEQIGATSRGLERALEMAAPLDVVGKRIADGIRRVTGKPSGPS